jgi:hypothetical protein
MTNQHMDENSSKYSDHISQRADSVSPVSSSQAFQTENSQQPQQIRERLQSDTILDFKKSPKPKSKKNEISSSLENNTALNMVINSKKSPKKSNYQNGSSLTQSAKMNNQNSNNNKRKLIETKTENTNNIDDLNKTSQELSYSINTIQSASQNNNASTAHLINHLVSKQQNSQQLQQQQNQSSLLINPNSNEYMQQMFYHQANVFTKNQLFNNLFNINKMTSLLPNLNTPQIQSQIFNQNNSNISKNTEKLLPKIESGHTNLSKLGLSNQHLEIMNGQMNRQGKCAENNGNLKDVLDLSLPNRSRSSLDLTKIANNSNTVIKREFVMNFSSFKQFLKLI